MLDKYKLSFEYHHKIGNIVYSTTTGERGIVIDIIHYTHANYTAYLVSFGRLEGDHAECSSIEISKEKQVF